MNRLIERATDKVEHFFKIIQFIKISRELDFNPLSQFIISGDPRGGTTWLAEIIQSIPDTALIWEPLSLNREKTFVKHDFSYRQFINENAYKVEVKATFEKLFSGRILNPFLCQFTNPRELKNANQLLIKFCRANQLLPWLTRQFEFKYDPIYIVRHPCAVIASQLKQGGWDKVSRQFHIPPNKRYSEFYSKHEDFLLSIDSKVKVLAAIWCLCNLVPLHHPQNNKKWITLTYESLVIEGKSQLKRIEDRWGINLPKSAYDKLNKASATTIKGSPILERKGSQLSYWKELLSEKEMSEIFEVLEYFKIDLYTSDSIPTKSFY